MSQQDQYLFAHWHNFFAPVGESKGGAVKFIEAKTGNEVTLQNTEGQEASKDEYQGAAGKKEHCQGLGRWEENSMEPRDRG